MEALTALSLLPLAAAVLALRWIWTDRLSRPIGLLLFAAALVFAVLLTAQNWGIGRAVAWAVIAISLYAAALLVWGRTSKPDKPLRIRKRRTSMKAEWPDWPKRWLVAVFLAGLASLGLALLTAVTLPLANGVRVMISLLVLTVMWPVLAGWALGSDRLRRTSGILVALLVSSAGAATAAFLA